MLLVRQLWLVLVSAPDLNAQPYNPRNHLGMRFRGMILARDHSVLAKSDGSQRVYPLGAALAQTVGYISQRYGTSGLEAAYDGILEPAASTESFGERWRELFDRRSHHPAFSAGQVVTTIVPQLQTAVYKELLPYSRAAAIAMDPRNGDILAIASVPSFDPQHIDTEFAALATNPQSAFLNRVSDGLYPPGSTFKIVTAVAALEHHIVDLNTRFVDPGYLDVDGYRVHDDEGEATGTQSFAGAFALSSNVDFAHIGLNIGVDRFYDTLGKFGFGMHFPFPLEVARDRIPLKETVSDSILAQLAFGQADLLVTPLRMVLVASSVAEQGAEPLPRLVHSIIDARGNERLLETHTIAHPFHEQTARDVTFMMEQVTAWGTGTAAALPGVQVAGKTGTATNPEGAAHAWFVAFAPSQAPRIAVAVIVENAGYGGRVAAPIARHIIEDALALPERTQ